MPRLTREPSPAMREAMSRVAAYQGVRAEGVAARAWRKAMGLSRRELAERTGYAERTIAAYEAGQFEPGKPVQPNALVPYRLACAAIALGVSFDWRTATLQLGAATITVPTVPEGPDAAAAPSAADVPEPSPEA